MKAVFQLILCSILSLVITSSQAGNDSPVEKITIRLDFVPDLEEGQKTFGVCARCHLPEAWGNIDGTYPQLAGQHVNVLMKQLLDIRSGDRQSPLMYPFVQERTIGGYQELSNVVAYISTLPMNPAPSKGPWKKGSAEFKQGEKIYNQLCTSCHGDSGQGNNELVYPRLQGQHFQYLSQQLARIKSGVREVIPAMQMVIKDLEDEQLEKIANYITYLEVPKDDIATSKQWRNPDFQ